MKLLLLTPQSPYPPRQGTTLRNYYLLRHLASQHEVDLFTCIGQGAAGWPDPILEELCGKVACFRQPERPLRRRILDSFLSGKPDMGLRIAAGGALGQLQRMLAEKAYDLVQVEGLEMAPYGYAALQMSRQRPTVVLDSHNAEFLLQKRAALMDSRDPGRWPAAFYSWLQWRKLQRYERDFCRAVDGVVAVSEPDRRVLASLAPGRPTVNVPNGIEISRYHPEPLPENTPPLLVFTGKMDYRPNVDAMLWFGLRVLPLIRRQFDIRLQIVGMDPHPRLDRLRAMPDVELTGAVEDVVPYIHGASVYVTPMRVGGGTRFKILEALACARPVVGTELAVEGIPVQDGEHVLMANSAQSFADAVVQLLRDQAGDGKLSRALGTAGRALVEERFTWASILPQLDAFHSQLV